MTSRRRLYVCNIVVLTTLTNEACISLLSSSNHLQKGEKLAKGVNKLVGKVSINLLCLAKSALCVISIIIYTPKQID